VLQERKGGPASPGNNEGKRRLCVSSRMPIAANAATMKPQKNSDLFQKSSISNWRVWSATSKRRDSGLTSSSPTEVILPPQPRQEKIGLLDALDHSACLSVPSSPDGVAQFKFRHAWRSSSRRRMRARTNQMSEYKPQNPEEHFALQRATRAAEVVKAVSEAQQKRNEETRSANERFYNSLALFSSGTVALSVTYLGYLKNLSKPVQHPHWLIACWICLMTCAACSLFCVLVYGYYSHYFHETQTANALKEQYETEAKEYPMLVRNTVSLQTKALTSEKEIADIVSNRKEAASILGKKAAGTKDREKFYMRFWRVLGWVAQGSFLGGLGLLLAFAIKNM
jgi:hypothetical protein